MKKRGAPAHLQKPVFNHPKDQAPFIAILETIDDPRGLSPNFSYSLTSILFIVTVTILCGAEDWEDMASMGEQMQEWIGQYVDIASGIPSSFTLERVISLIEPSALESMLGEVSQLFCSPSTEDVIAIDGKSLCGSRDKVLEKRAVHILNAWSCQNRICIGQMKVDDKSNEITAICTLLDRIFIKDSIITTDALNTQTNTVAKIIEKGGHYVLPIKGNHSGLLESIKLLFTEAERVKFQGIDADEWESLEKSRGRVEERFCTVLDASELQETKEWKELKTAAKITRRRTVEGKTTEEVIYYISDLGLDASKIAKVVREHWSIENGLHHALDVVLSEDDHIYRNRNGAANLSALRKIVLAALEKVGTKKKRSKKTKRLLAAIDPIFRSECLKFIF